MSASKSILPAIALLALSLAACKAERTPDNATTNDAAPAMDQPAGNVPPATASNDNAFPPEPPMQGPAQAPGKGLERMDGFGDMRFGMTEAEAKQAWGGDLEGLAGGSQDCHYVMPTYNKAPRDLAFMIEGDKFVRYDVGVATMSAPGGGKVGMGADAIRKLYGAQVKETPHKYVEGGKNLSIADAAGGTGKLVFETDKDGKVTSWRAGVPPQVEYVEGCS